VTPTPPVRIERATPADAPALLRAQIRAFEHDALIYPGVAVGGPPGYDSLDVLLAHIQTDDTYKIEADGHIVGGMVIFDRGEGRCHLDVIFIDPDYHDRGIGTRAMHYLDEHYAARLWTLDTPTWAVRNQHFYEKLGFIKVGEVQYEDDDTPLFAYEKRLD